MSCASLDQKVMLELPVNRMASAGAGRKRSRASKRRMLASQACGSPLEDRNLNLTPCQLFTLQKLANAALQQHASRR